MDDETPTVWSALLDVVRYRWLLIVALGVVGALGALILSMAQAQRYTATSEFVLGGTDVPAQVSELVDQEGTGPLSADLKAETQERVLGSGEMAFRVARTLGLDQGEDEDLWSSFRGRAVTDNSFTVTVDGPSASLAADYANAWASEYIAFRQEAVDSVLSDLGERQRDLAQSSSLRAERLDEAIARALARNEVSDASVLRATQQQLLANARSAGELADLIEAVADSPEIVGSVTDPASAGSTTQSPLVVRDTLFGAALGLIVGVVLAVVLEKLTDRVRSRGSAAAAAGAPVLMDLPGRRRGEWRAEYLHQAQLAALALGWDRTGMWRGELAVRPLTPSPEAADVALALASAHSELTGQRVAVRADAGAAQVVERAATDWADLGMPDALDDSVASSSPGILVTGDHAHQTDPSTWPISGTSTLLVVHAERDGIVALRRTVHELSLRGLCIAGVALIAASGHDETLGVAQDPFTAAPTPRGVDPAPVSVE